MTQCEQYCNHKFSHEWSFVYGIPTTKVLPYSYGMHLLNRYLRHTIIFANDNNVMLMFSFARILH